MSRASVVAERFNSAYAYRKSETQWNEFGAISTWLRLGELEAQAMACALFDREKLRQAVKMQKTFGTKNSELNQSDTLHVEFLQKEIRGICANSGVVVVFVPEIKCAPIYGATRWLSTQKAIILLILRGKGNGNLCLSLFHEIGHVLIHGKRVAFLELDKGRENEREEEVDRFARCGILYNGE